jgi:hypothetical protein
LTQGKRRGPSAAPPVDLIALKMHRRAVVAFGAYFDGWRLGEFTDDLSLGSGGLFHRLPTVLVPHQPVDGAKRQDRKGKAEDHERLGGC